MMRVVRVEKCGRRVAMGRVAMAATATTIILVQKCFHGQASLFGELPGTLTCHMPLFGIDI
jgi:hypothetical protein